MGVEIHRHELKHPAVFADAPLELRLPLVGGEGHRGDRTASIVNWNRESASDTKSGGLLEQFALRTWIVSSNPTTQTPFEGFGTTECLKDNGIKALVVVLQIVLCPGGRVV